MSSHEALKEPPDIDSFNDEVFTPIGDEYEEYDPESDIRKLKELPSYERRRWTLELKREYANRSLAVANIYKDVLSRLYENPECTWQEIRRIVHDICERYEISTDIENYVYLAFQRFQMKKNTIDALLARYPDVYQLFERVFSFRPKGRIEVKRGPVSIDFHIFNSDDYFFVLERYWPETNNESESYRNNLASKTGGICLTNYSQIPGLEGSILVENCEKTTDKVVEEHEIQHSHFDILRRTVLPFFLPEFSANEIASLQNETLTDDSADDFLIKVKRYFKAERRDAEDLVKDEILAYMKSKKASKQYFNAVITDDILWGEYTGKDDLDDYKFSIFELNIYYTLVKSKDEGGLYDYTYDKRRVLSQNLKYYFDDPIKCEKLIEEVFINDYRSLVARGIKAYKDLFDMGFHHEEIIGVLSFHSLANWSGIVKKISVERRRNRV